MKVILFALAIFCYLSSSAALFLGGTDVRDSRCPPAGDFGTCGFCGACSRGLICCFNGCGTSCMEPLPSCPDGVGIVRCIARPCSVTTCPAYPDATCVDDYCGGCNTIFSDSLGNVLSDEDCNPPCPEGVHEVNCKASPCSVTTCPAYPDATCEDDYCGGCNAIFSDSLGNVLSDEDCNPPATPCPDGVNIVYCFASPCSVNTCPAYPDATCVDDYCGGCNAIFSDSSGNVLSDEECTPPTLCPDGVGIVNCFARPCSVNRCPAYRDATCEDDYCGGCNAIFRDSLGNVLNREDCMLDGEEY